MKKNIAGIIILLLAGISFNFFLFKPVVLNPNSYLYSKSGDAVKSYYNFSYYLKYDSGLRHDGINYPYGDHLQYINSHPLYVNILKFIDNNFYKIDNYGPGILNLTMIISLILALPFIFLILRRFSLPVWYSVVISLIILYLTPQFDRIHGHFEMVYAFFIPMYWYLLILYLEGKKKALTGTLLVVAGLIGGFTSAYYVAFYAIFILAVLVVKIWENRKVMNRYKFEALYLFLIAMIPIIVVKGLVSITDWVDDRPDNPWGFFIFHANIFSIFLPQFSKLKYIFGDPHFLRYAWEGKAYVGFPAAVLALIIFLSVLLSLSPRLKLKIKSFFPNKKLNIFLAASVIVLLFSMAFPFKYGLAFLKDLIPPLKQFRALGRFSWIFYYVFTVYTAYIAYVYYRYLRTTKVKMLAPVLIILTMGFWIVDAGVNTKNSTKGLFNSNDLLTSSSEKYLEGLRKGGINISDYQAILFLPYANTCGDKLLFTDGMYSFNKAMECSYYTALPLIQSFSPRLSFTHALSSIQLLADPAIPKTRLNDMNDKPILVLKTGNELSNQEQWLFDHATKLMIYDDVDFAEIYPDSIKKSHSLWQRNAREKISEIGNSSQNIVSDTLQKLIIHKSFDSNEEPYQVLFGHSAFYLKKGREFILTKDDFRQLPPGRYNITFWLYVDTRTDNMPEAIFYRWGRNGEQLLRQKWNTRQEHNIYKHWVRIDEVVELDQDSDFALEIKGKYISLDELLLQPLGSNVVVHNNEVPLLNNYPVL